MLVSAALGALFAGIPLLSSTAEWDEWVKPVYGASVCVAFLLGAISFSAARGMSDERAESVGDIKTDLDRLLAAYEVPEGQDEPISPAEIEQINQRLIRDSLRQIRVEARANREMLERADEQGQYWKVTEGGPETKKWKDNEPLLRGERELEPLLDTGLRVAQELERVRSGRAMKVFKLNRDLDPDARLPEVIELLRGFERDIIKALDDEHTEA